MAAGQRKRPMFIGPSRYLTLRLNNPLPATRRFDEPQAQLVQHLLEELPLLQGQVAARLLLEQRKDLDHLRGAVEIRLRGAPGDRIREVAEMNGGGARQREHERGK